jgi:uncharacterized protein (TIGR02646 family)
VIFIDRNRLDDQSRPIQPDNSWFDRAAAATDTAEQEGDAHVVQEDIYRDNQARAALEELFHRKCAYCESDISNSTWEVEHFRPKGRVAERVGHPGYYWLAYAWSNLYPACEFCNKRRRDRPLWGDLRFATTGGKLDHFPLEDETQRAMTYNDDLGLERPLLLDPCKADPENHLRYNIFGEILHTRGDEKVKATISVFHLKRRRLRDTRKNQIEAVLALLKIIAEQKRAGNVDAAEDLEGYLQDFLLGDQCKHAGAARFVVKDPNAFGV